MGKYAVIITGFITLLTRDTLKTLDSRIKLAQLRLLILNFEATQIKYKQFDFEMQFIIS